MSLVSIGLLFVKCLRLSPPLPHIIFPKNNDGEEKKYGNILIRKYAQHHSNAKSELVDMVTF